MKTIKKTIVSALVLLPFFSTSAFAMAYPRSEGFSDHIVSVNYNPENVTLVRVKVGVVTLIQLQNGETVTGSNSGVGVGDINAWGLAVRGNNIFIKPKTLNPTTNLVITTNKNRTYTFLLEDTKSNINDTYVLKFNYPITKAEKMAMLRKKQAEISENRVIAEKEKIKLYQVQYHQAQAQMLLNAENKYKNSLPCSNGNNVNWQYLKWGDQSLSPIAVWDNGQFTCFDFPQGEELPLIYSVNKNGSESLLNTFIDHNITVVHSVHTQYRLRIGKLVMGIETNHLKPVGNNTNSMISGYHRVIK